MKTDMPITDFWAALKEHMGVAFDMRSLTLTPGDENMVEELRKNVYSRWSWNYGGSPAYTLRRARRVEGCGKIEILLDIGKEGIIRNIAFYGDFFGNREPDELGDMLIGRPLVYDEVKAALAGVDISRYFHALDSETFFKILLEAQ